MHFQMHSKGRFSSSLVPPQQLNWSFLEGCPTSSTVALQQHAKSKPWPECDQTKADCFLDFGKKAKGNACPLQVLGHTVVIQNGASKSLASESSSHPALLDRESSLAQVDAAGIEPFLLSASAVP